MASIPHIAVIGSLNVDLVTRTPRVPAAGETLTASSFALGFGGKGANQASACSRLSRPKLPKSSKAKPPSAKVSMVGAVGDDQFSQGMLDSLKEDGVDVSEVRIAKGKSTGTATILVEEATGENRILFTPGANGVFEEKDNLIPKDVDVVLFQMEIPLKTVLHNIEVAKAQGVQVILNPAPALPIPISIYPSIDHLIVNSSEALILSSSLENPEDAQQQLDSLSAPLLDAGVPNLIITLGSRGCYYHTLLRFSSGQPGRLIPASPVEKVVDTTGAGDAFVGAYAVKVAEGLRKRENVEVEGEGRGWVSRGVSVDEAVAWASRVAAKSVEREGARGGVPWGDEVE
ncbi:Ribokinase-like protein [Rhizodiscina lignyota]|uniref:Ribokinase n=1 Tax=Rhizodiscina lignyota TaxID=1504668 RepID=A0A9P4IC83_9PEZI|nr:Ribokinase-like protein [Rhizodiscina lignyota]